MWVTYFLVLEDEQEGTVQAYGAVGQFGAYRVLCGVSVPTPILTAIWFKRYALHVGVSGARFGRFRHGSEIGYIVAFCSCFGYYAFVPFW